MAALLDVKTLYNKEVENLLGQPQAASEDAIDALESELSLPLPIAYREYLQWMGNDVEGLFRGSNWYLDDVVDNLEIASELLSEHGKSFGEVEAPLCFFTHQGYMAAWFDLKGQADDPNCFYFFEGSNENQICGPIKFSDFLMKDVRGNCQLIKKYGRKF